ncbi:hypothetical protein [Georgenia sp. Z1491]|uniref:hypothetical protein n=1 Tax=Georgenia sp. Z1491 TaxID=3416707 RepID=UPI003CF2582E
MRHGRSIGVGATLALAAALAACSPVESLDDEETTEAEESPSGSASEQPTAGEESEESTTDGTDDPEAPSAADDGPADPEEETDESEEEPTSDGAEEEAPPLDGEQLTVEHDAGTVSYTLPEEWNDLSFAYEGHPTIVMGAAPLATAANGTQVTLTAIEGGAGSYEAYREALEQQRPPDAEMTDADPLTVDGATVEGLRVEMSTPTGGFVQYTYPIFEGGYQWELQFAMDAADEEGDLPGMRQVAGSITIE